jgi:hypothetical protein
MVIWKGLGGGGGMHSLWLFCSVQNSNRVLVQYYHYANQVGKNMMLTSPDFILMICFTIHISVPNAE